MKEEDKKLLLIDLCARLPYGVKVLMDDVTIGLLENISIVNDIAYINKFTDNLFGTFEYNIDEIKPYLRPMSSMTEEEEKEYRKTQITKWIKSVDCTYGGYYNHRDTLKTFDWFNAHHFDYRELIKKGLAIEVTKENNPYKN